MFPFAELASEIVQTVLYSLSDTFFLIILGAIGFFIYRQYRRMSDAEQRMFGTVLHPPGDQLLRAIGSGLIGGLVATCFFVLLGITLPTDAILYLWVISLLLAMIQPRFLCFAYSGGLIALAALLLGVPDIQVGPLMALIGVLHLVEAVLIWLQGGVRTTPVYARRADGRVVGGFMMQKFWPIPFIAVIGALFPAELIGSGSIEMPDWWPLIGTPPDPGTTGQVPALFLFMAFAALGYGDLALTSTPQVKARYTSRNLFVYSVLLLGLAFLADRHWGWTLLAALFSPLAHEWVIHLGRRREEKEPPIYTGEHGPMVLAVLPESPAEAMGLEPGDVLVSLNGMDVRSRHDVSLAISPWAFEVELVVRNVNTGEERVVRHRGRCRRLASSLHRRAGSLRWCGWCSRGTWAGCGDAGRGVGRDG